MSFASTRVSSFQSTDGGILQLHQTLDVAQTFEGGKRFSVRDLKQILIASLRKSRVSDFQASCDRFYDRGFHFRAERVNHPSEPPLQRVSGGISLLLQIACLRDNAVADEGDVGLG